MMLSHHFVKTARPLEDEKQGEAHTTLAEMLDCLT